MSVLYIMVPMALFLAVAALIAFFWSVRDGQYDDLESPAHRILFDDEPCPIAKTPTETKQDAENREDNFG